LKKFSQFGHNVRKYRLANTATTGFNTIMGQFKYCLCISNKNQHALMLFNGNRFCHTASIRTHTKLLYGLYYYSHISGVRRKFSWGFVTSYSYFQTNILAKSVDMICIFFYIHSPYFMCHCTEYQLLPLQVRILEKIHSTLPHSSSLLQKYQAAR